MTDVIKPEEPYLPARSKRPRSSRACVMCHSRKVRCNVVDQMPCANCVAFDCECSIPEPRKVRRENPKEETEAEADAEGAEKETETATNPPQPAMFEPLLHPIDAVLGCPSLDTLELEILQLRGAFITPSKACLLEIFEAFFAYIHPIFPIFNRARFYREFHACYSPDEPTSKPMSLLLIHSLCVAGSRVVDKNSLLFVEFPNTDRDAISLAFYKRAKSLYDCSCETDPITVIRSLLLLSWFWDGPDDVSRNSFYWCRIAISLSLGFGFQRDVSRSKAMDAWEKKIWRRVWWCLFVRDRQVAIAFGRPVAIDLDDCDVPMLRELDFDESDTLYEGESVGNPPSPNDLLEAKFFMEVIKLSEITGIIIKQQYLVRASNLHANNKIPVIQHCDLVLGNWFNHVPPELQFLPSRVAENKARFAREPTGCYLALLLNIEYYSILCLVHRSNILRQSKGLPKAGGEYPSQGIAYQAAYMTTLIAKIMHQQDQLKYCPSFVCYTLFSASMIMALTLRAEPDLKNQLREDADHRKKAFECLVTLQAAQRNIGRVWGFGRLTVLVLEAILSSNLRPKDPLNRKTDTPPTDHAALGSSGKTPIGNLIGLDRGLMFVTSSYPPPPPLLTMAPEALSIERAGRALPVAPTAAFPPEPLLMAFEAQGFLPQPTPGPPLLPAPRDVERAVSPMVDNVQLRPEDLRDIHLLINETPLQTLFMPASLFPEYNFSTGEAPAVNGMEDILTPHLARDSVQSDLNDFPSVADWDNFSFGGFGGLFGVGPAKNEGSPSAKTPMGSRDQSPANWMSLVNP